MPGRPASRRHCCATLEAMDDGAFWRRGAAGPSRCPPALMNRASLIAHYLKTRSRAQGPILDPKDAIPQQRLFENAWKELYPGHDIERVVALSQGGGSHRRSATTPSSLISATTQPRSPTLFSAAGPGRIAGMAGSDRQHGWCPIDPSRCLKTRAQTFTSSRPCFGGGHPPPKSASAAMPRPRPARRGGELDLGRGTADTKAIGRVLQTRSRPVTPSRNPASTNRRTGYSSRSRAAVPPRRCAARGPHA